MDYMLLAAKDPRSKVMYTSTEINQSLTDLKTNSDNNTGDFYLCILVYLYIIVYLYILYTCIFLSTCIFCLPVYSVYLYILYTCIFLSTCIFCLPVYSGLPVYSVSTRIFYIYLYAPQQQLCLKTSQNCSACFNKHQTDIYQ